jgi:hypothetical protein
MNQLLMERYLTHSRVMKNEKSEEKVEEMLFVYGYWVDLVEYKGEKKERYKFLDGNDEVRKFYEGLFEDYVLQREYVRFLDMGAEKNVKGKEGATSSFTKENVSKFIALRKLDDSLYKSSKSADEKEDFQGELKKVPVKKLIKVVKRVKRKSNAPEENVDIKKRFPGRKLVPVLTILDSIKKQEKRFAKKKKLV